MLRMPPLTQHRDLHGGRTPWQSTRALLPPHAVLRRDRACDVLVVGAGISGALAADALSDAGLHVLVCDRRFPLQGATLASTAMVLYETDLPLLQLIARLGRRDAERIWRRSFLAARALRDRAHRLGIDATLEDHDTLYLQGDLLDARGLRREAEARARAGFDVGYLAASEVAARYGIRRRAALLAGGATSANPRALAAGFLRAAAARGGGLLAPEEIIDVRARATGVRAFTRSGHQIHARHLVFATGYELPRVIPARGHRIVSTWAIATPPQRRTPWPGPSLIWEASESYLYLRTTAEGRVLCGGGDADIADAARRDALLGRKAAWLQRRLSALLPQVDARVEFAWSGSFGASASGLPTIGPVPGLRNCYAVLGYGGNGITFSMLAAQMLRNLLTGGDEPDLDLVRFRPDR
jgi:glycine/D-amino acid oxidase-like deaminating enzyme